MQCEERGDIVSENGITLVRRGDFSRSVSERSIYALSASSYPIHLAVLSGKFEVVQWLCCERFCPLRSTRKRGKSKEGPILSSKGRSPLALALTDQKLDIVRYLVADKHMSFFEEKGLTTATALANFTSMLRMVPRDVFEGRKMEITQVPTTSPTFSGSSSFSLASISD